MDGYTASGSATVVGGAATGVLAHTGVAENAPLFVAIAIVLVAIGVAFFIMSWRRKHADKIASMS